MKSIPLLLSLFSIALLPACQSKKMHTQYGSMGNAVDTRPMPTGTAEPRPNPTGTGPLMIKGSVAVPPADAIVARLQRGLEGAVSVHAGNFAKSYAQALSSLPKVSDPRQASGFDQVQLLVYAACSDLTTGGNSSTMKTKYGVDTGSSVNANQSALVNAGIRMMDQYVAGLASEGTASDQVFALFTQLVGDLASASGNTSTMAFMAVCIAANTAGSTMLGF